MPDDTSWDHGAVTEPVRYVVEGEDFDVVRDRASVHHLGQRTERRLRVFGRRIDGDTVHGRGGPGAHPGLSVSDRSAHRLPGRMTIALRALCVTWVSAGALHKRKREVRKVISRDDGGKGAAAGELCTY